MTTYKNLRGKRIKTFATDLDNEQAEGQIFYQDTANEFKTVVSSAAWSAGANGITARPAVGGFGIQTSAVMFGGGPASKSSLTEEYNGTGFTTSGTLNTGRPTCQDNGWGVETAGVVASGNTPGGNTVNVEEYNGSSWSEVNNVSVARRQQASIGLVQTAGAICGGFVSANTDATEEYDGTNWTNGGNLNTTRRGFVGAGTLTAGIVYSGYTTEIVTNTEEYNGTAWTNATAINTARNNGAGSTNAPQSTALLFGGNTGSDTGNTEQYNGTTWTEVADMAVARDGLGGGGIGSTALAAFGKTDADVSNTEEFNTTVNTITGAAWSSGGNLGTARSRNTGGGTLTAGICVTGIVPGDAATVNVEEYNGTSWTEQNNIPAGLRDPSGFGTQTAFVGAGGYTPSPAAIVSATNEYDGTNWTSGGALNVARESASIHSGGTLTAGVLNGGGVPPYKQTEEYNGTSWANANASSQDHFRTTITGTQTAAFIFGGYGIDPGGPQAGASVTFTEEYDGTNFSSGDSLLAGGNAPMGMASPNKDDSTCAGGFDQASSSRLSLTQNYNGTAWATGASLGTARYAGTGGGSAAGGFVAGGHVPPTTNATEELTAETTALNLKTITDS